MTNLELRRGIDALRIELTQNGRNRDAHLLSVVLYRLDLATPRVGGNPQPTEGDATQ